MEIRFDDQVVLVTGASGGIGAALARAFGAAGASVVVHFHRNAASARVVVEDIQAAGSRALAVQADLTDPAQVERVVEAAVGRFSRVDILINNAGTMFSRQPIAETPDALYYQIMDLNMTAVFRMCRLVIPIMQRQGRGNIINLSSISARRGGGGGSVLYGASKAAISTFTRGLAKELVAHHIRVNAIAPGWILTPLHERYTPPDRMEAGIEMIPMKRAGRPEECVGAAFFLASEAMSSYITGQVIEVNGGLLMP